MPRPKKTAGTAVDRRNGQRLVDVGPAPDGVQKVDPPDHICESARAAWDDFWADRPALLLTPSSRVVLLRWVDALDRYLRTSAEADQQPLVEGSQGQLVVNPLYKIAQLALSTVTDCERQLGIGGLNAANLGLAAISEKRSLQEMNARYGGDPRGGDQGADEDDPRKTIQGKVHGS